MNLFQHFKAFLRYREAVRIALERHAADGNRYYVMPTDDDRCRLVVVDRRNFRRLKLKHYISPEATVRHLVAACFFCTPYRDGNGCMTRADRHRRYRAYLAWWKSRLE